MEPLLLVLFLLFSIVSALMERRKRRQQLEEAQQRRLEREGRLKADQTAPAPRVDVEAEEEEPWGGWPFPPGDPFDRPQPPARQQLPPRPGAPAPPLTDDGRALVQELERQAREAERRAQDEEEQARARLRTLQSAPPRRQIAEVLRERGAPARSQAPTPRRGRPPRAAMTPRRARNAVIYMEIFGPCKAERAEEWRW